MIIDFLLEVKESIDKHGIRFGLIFAIYAVYRKERRNSRLDKRDADVFHNQKVIMEHLGVGEQWRGQVSSFQNEEVRSLKKLYLSLQQESRKENLLRRVKKMNQNINWATLVPCLLGAIKLILQPMGINIPDQNLNEIANGVAALATVIGIIYSHRKGSVSNVPTQSAATIGDNR